MASLYAQSEEKSSSSVNCFIKHKRQFLLESNMSGEGLGTQIQVAPKHMFHKEGKISLVTEQRKSQPKTNFL